MSKTLLILCVRILSFSILDINWHAYCIILHFATWIFSCDASDILKFLGTKILWHISTSPWKTRIWNLAFPNRNSLEFYEEFSRHTSHCSMWLSCCVGKFFSRLVTLEKRVKETGLLKDTFCLVGMKTYSFVVELNKIDYTFEEKWRKSALPQRPALFFFSPQWQSHVRLRRSVGWGH